MIMKQYSIAKVYGAKEGESFIWRNLTHSGKINKYSKTHVYI